MEFSPLSSAVAMKTVSETATNGVFEIEGLYAGYGLTIGNSLRRVLLSSLPGAAATEIKVKGVSHEFSTLPGLQEDIVGLSLNFKKLRFASHSVLNVKGEREVTGADIELNANVVLMNPQEVLGHLTAKDAELDIEVKVERGLGYVPVEARRSEGGRTAIGTIAIDAIFTPVQRVNYTIEDMRVGDRTDYNRVRLEIETDGTVSPSGALRKAAAILKDHFEKVSEVDVKDVEAPAEVSETGVKKKARKKS
jgi:DNA-directed RNA polymerase subunit alpha